ncbi:ATP synthase small subunit 6, mitochondrial-like [Rosa rugosa]|uniref:ATP synthase small subunit 6, mitochondrial-like n=1 Tax=Rosa rugosa TaxID=74645 RepID=UPI002B4151B4|nr:ATP synthase small subunit 6, mitochondrial-like [Rosa rugosa]
MRKFDPWPVFFKREWNQNWPFLVDFAITGTLITKFSLSLTGTPLHLSFSSQ